MFVHTACACVDTCALTLSIHWLVHNLEYSSSRRVLYDTMIAVPVVSVGHTGTYVQCIIYVYHNTHVLRIVLVLGGHIWGGQIRYNSTTIEYCVE